VSGATIGLTEFAVAQGIGGLSKPQARALARALARLLRPPGSELTLATRDLRQLLGDMRSVVGSSTPAVRRKRLGKLAHDVIGILGTKASVGLNPKNKTVVAVRFDVPATTNPTGIGGFLELDISAAGKPTEFDVPVAVGLGALTQVTFEPSTIQLQQTWPFRADSKQVELRGPGVSALFASGPPGDVNVNLGGPSANDIRVSLHDLTQLSGVLATGTVSIQGGPAPGSFTATVPASRADDAPPQLTVDVRSALSRLVAFVLIVLGIAVGGLAPRTYALKRRKQLLCDALADAISNYRLHVTPDSVRPTSWDLSQLLKPVMDHGQLKWTGAVARVDADITSARNDADLDDDTTRVLDVVARVQRWLRLEPAARRLDAVISEPLPHAPLGALHWNTTGTYLDSLTVLRALKHEPANAAAADELAAQVLWQMSWYYRFGQAWAAADQTGGPTPDDLHSLEEALAKTPVLERTAAQRDELAARLDALFRRTGLAPGSVPLLNELQPGAARVISPEPDWDVPPELFTGWATLDGLAYHRIARHAGRLQIVAPAYSRLADAAPTPAKTRLDKPPSFAAPPNQPGGRREPWLRRADVVWSVLLIAGASLAYMVTIYKDTWGSLEDLLTAAAAGFGTAVVIQWAALPVFQSLRLRAGSAAAAGSSPAAAGSGTSPPAKAG